MNPGQLTSNMAGALLLLILTAAFAGGLLWLGGAVYELFLAYPLHLASAALAIFVALIALDACTWDGVD